MATIIIDDQDVKTADAFLTAYLSGKIPDADFSEGSVVRDFVVKAMAYMFAYLQKEIQTVKDRQSILSLSTLPADSDVDDAVDAILSNWFLSRLEGRVSRLPNVVLNFSRQTDVVLTTQTRFFRTASLAFVPEVDVVVPANELRPTVGSDGVITGYTTTITLKATNVGDEYNVEPGRFVSADTFNPFFLFAENTTEGVDGEGRETTEALLKRAPTAIAVRNLVNERSINTVLRQNFPSVSKVRVVGFGDSEMLRDKVAEGPGHLQMHVGGHTDIYVTTPRTDVTETLDIGAFFARPDNLVNILRDDSVDFSPVSAGDVLRITAGLSGSASEYIIVNKGVDYVEVTPRYPFSAATDEATPVATNVTYSIGNLGPTYNNIIAAQTTGQTSRKIQAANTVALAGQPHYKIKSVERLTGPVGSEVITPITERVNTAPTTTNQYQVIELNTGTSQSSQAVTQVIVHSSYTTGRLRITYETLVEYAGVQSYVTDRFERVICSNTLVKAMHPIYVEVVFRYRLAAEALIDADPADVAKAVASFVNQYGSEDRLDLSALRSHVRATFPQIGVIYEPFDVRYKLLAPDGQVYYFTTKDVLSVLPAWPDNNTRLLNGLALRAPISNADVDASASSGNAALAAVAHAAIRDQMAVLGVSDRNLRYIADLADVQITKES
jgi:hypothetical protein